MAKSNEPPPEDRETLREIGETLKRNGFKLADDQTSARPSDTPTPDKTSWVERARVKDLGQDQGKEPEGVAQTKMSWADRVIASRENQAEQSQGRGGDSRGSGKAHDTSKTNSAQRNSDTPGKTTAETKPSEPTSWADRVIASRPQGYGHGKAEGLEKDEPEREKGAKKEAGSTVNNEKQKSAKPKVQDKGQSNEHENER